MRRSIFVFVMKKLFNRAYDNFKILRIFLSNQIIEYSKNRSYSKSFFYKKKEFDRVE